MFRTLEDVLSTRSTGATLASLRDNTLAVNKVAVNHVLAILRRSSLCLVIGDPARGKTTTILSAGYQLATSGWRVYCESADTLQIEQLLLTLSSSAKLKKQSLFVIDDCHRSPHTVSSLLQALLNRDLGNARVLMSSRRVRFPPLEDGETISALKSNHVVYDLTPSSSHLREVAVNALSKRGITVDESSLNWLLEQVGTNLRLLNYYVASCDANTQSLQDMTEAQIARRIAADYDFDNAQTRLAVLKVAGVFAFDVPVSDELVDFHLWSLIKNGLLLSQDGYLSFPHSADAEWLLRAAERLNLLAGCAWHTYARTVLADYARLGPANLDTALIAAKRDSLVYFRELCASISGKAILDWLRSTDSKHILEFLDLFKKEKLASGFPAIAGALETASPSLHLHGSGEVLLYLKKLSHVAPTLCVAAWSDWHQTFFPALPADCTLGVIGNLGRILRRVEPSAYREFLDALVSERTLPFLLALIEQSSSTEVATFFIPSRSLPRAALAVIWSAVAERPWIDTFMNGITRPAGGVFRSFFTAIALVSRDKARDIWNRYGRELGTLTNKDRILVGYALGYLGSYYCKSGWESLKPRPQRLDDVFSKPRVIARWLTLVFKYETDPLSRGRWFEFVGELPANKIQDVYALLQRSTRFEATVGLAHYAPKAVERLIATVDLADLDEMKADIRAGVSGERQGQLLDLIDSRTVATATANSARAFTIPNEFIQMLKRGGSERSEVDRLLATLPADSSVWATLLRYAEGPMGQMLVQEILKRTAVGFSTDGLHSLIFNLAWVSAESAIDFVQGASDDFWLDVIDRYEDRLLFLLLADLAQVSLTRAYTLFRSTRVEHRIKASHLSYLDLGTVEGLLEVCGVEWPRRSDSGLRIWLSDDELQRCAGVLQLACALVSASHLNPRRDLSSVREVLNELEEGARLPPLGLNLLDKCKVACSRISGEEWVR